MSTDLAIRLISAAIAGLAITLLITLVVVRISAALRSIRGGFFR